MPFQLSSRSSAVHELIEMNVRSIDKTNGETSEGIRNTVRTYAHDVGNAKDTAEHNRTQQDARSAAVHESVK